MILITDYDWVIMSNIYMRFGPVAVLLSFLPAGVFEPETLSNPIPKKAAEEATGRCLYMILIRRNLDKRVFDYYNMSQNALWVSQCI